MILWLGKAFLDLNIQCRSYHAIKFQPCLIMLKIFEFTTYVWRLRSWHVIFRYIQPWTLVPYWTPHPFWWDTRCAGRTDRTLWPASVKSRRTNLWVWEGEVLVDIASLIAQTLCSHSEIMGRGTPANTHLAGTALSCLHSRSIIFIWWLFDIHTVWRGGFVTVAVALIT